MSATTVKRSGNELVVEKILNAPRELVFEVWTNPNHLVHWWGPVGFTTTSREMDMRSGGTWRFTMHGPDGHDFLNKIVFLEVEKPSKLVYQHAGEGETADISFHVTVTFEQQGNQTRLTMKSVLSSSEELDRLDKEFNAIEGGRQHLDRLGEYLASIN